MPAREAPSVELGSAPQTPSVIGSPSPSEISSTSSPEPQNIRATPLFRALAQLPPEPEQPPGQDELERRLPGYRRIVIPRELTLIELLKQCSGVTSDEEVLRIREAKLRVVAERVGLRRLHVLAPRLRSLTLDGSALFSLRDLGIGLVHLKILSVNRCGLTSLDGVWGLSSLRELHAAGNRIQDLHPLAVLQKLHTLNLANNPISESGRIWTLGVCSSLRRLFLHGTPFSESPTYRSFTASTLTMLTTLDDQPLHTDVNSDYVEETANSSDSEVESDVEVEKQLLEHRPMTEEPMAGPSQISEEPYEQDLESHVNRKLDNEAPNIPRRRPATTENGGIRPSKPELPRRPRTAVERPCIDAPTRLEIMNTLFGTELEQSLGRTMADACRAIAEEIPRALCHEDWVKFREETGIEIDINFNERPQSMDPTKAIDRLERIERDTSERLKRAPKERSCYLMERCKALSIIVNDTTLWNETEQSPPISISHSDIDSVLSDVV